MLESSDALASDRLPRRVERRALLITVVSLSLMALWTLREVIPAALLGLWLSVITEPLSARVARKLGGRTRAAALLTTALISLLLAIVGVLLLPVLSDVMLVTRALRRLVPDRQFWDALGHTLATAAPTPHPLLGVARDIAPVASEAISLATSMLMQAIVFLLTAYYLAIDGRRLQAGLERVSPLGPEHTRQLVQEFVAVGRGIAMSMGLASFATAVALGAAYAVAGAPRPLMLAALTFFVSVLPIGAPFVWLPVSVVLLARGNDGGAFLVAGVGLVVVAGIIDHVVRPWLVRYGRLTLHPLLTILAIFGGVAAMGPWGVFLGPMIVALAGTTLRIYAQGPILARRSLIPGERVTLVSGVPAPATTAPKAIA